MNKILSNISIMFSAAISILQVGCGHHTYRYYEFEANTISIEYGEPKAALKGDFQKVSSSPQITSFGSPYNFVISFYPNVKEHNPSEVKNIKIKSKAGEILYDFDGGEMEDIWSPRIKSWFSLWDKSNVKLNHQSLTIEYELIFEVNNKKIKKSIIQKLEPKYKEEHKNDILDVILGV